MVKIQLTLHGHIQQGTASHRQVWKHVSVRYIICTHHILKWLSCFTLKRYWSVVVPTRMKLQWTPGNKVLWCHNWLERSYLWPECLSGCILYLI